MVVLDGSKPEDLAVMLALVPEWRELAEGLDMDIEQDRQEYQRRFHRRADERIEELAAEAAVLRLLPPD